MPFLDCFASYLPARVVTNAEVAQEIGCDAEWIRRTSGIEQRRYAAAEETVVDLAVTAGQRCLAMANGRPIGLLLVASGSSTRVFPGPAAGVAHRLGLGAVPALDFAMPSAGGLIALALASQLTSHQGDVLVVAAEKMSAVVKRTGTSPQVAALFGDGAGACVVSRDRGAVRVVDSVLHSDGAFEEALQLGFSAPMQMDGRTVIMQASRKIPQVIDELLERHGIPRDAVAAFLLHQANQNLTEQVAAAMRVPSSRFFSNVSRYGNTSSASLLIAAAEWSAAGGAERGAPVVLAAFGAGLHWGAMLVTGA